MFDVAPTELLLVVVVALVVIGPKDLPKAMRFVGKWVGKARGMARHFRAGIDTMIRESELEEMERKWRAHNEEIMRKYPDIADGHGADGSAVMRGPGDPLIGPPAPPGVTAVAPFTDAADAGLPPLPATMNGEPGSTAPAEQAARQ